MYKCNSAHIILYPLIQAGLTWLLVTAAGFHLISALLCAAGFIIIIHTLFHQVGTQLGIE